jgi:hypothetical protein
MLSPSAAPEVRGRQDSGSGKTLPKTIGGGLASKAPTTLIFNEFQRWHFPCTSRGQGEVP